VSKNILSIETWPIDKPTDYPNNARKWSKHAISKVAASIKAYGFRQPVVVDKAGVIIIGHLRRTAARTLGLTEIPVHVARDLSEAQCRGLRLMDNRSALESTFDIDMLSAEFLELKALDFDLSLTGFDLREIDSFTLQPNAAEDDVPEVPIAPVSQLGDLWLMGEHRLLCGDSTNSEHVGRLMNGKKANLLATDPPYLVNYTGGSHPQSLSNSPDVKDKGWESYKDPASSIEFYETFMRVGLEHLADGGAVYQWHAALMQYLVHQAWLKCGLLVHQHIVWVKAHAVLTHSHYMWQHEVAFYGWPQGRKPFRRPPANIPTVWNINQIGESDGIHPTQKPVELARRPIEYHTDPNGICYEPFSGSGTTIAAAEVTGRCCYAMEIAPEFVDCAVTRWQNLTGKEATLDGHGCTFEHAKFGRRLGAQDAVKEEVYDRAE